MGPARRLAALFLAAGLCLPGRAADRYKPEVIDPAEAYRRVNTGFFDLERNVPASAAEVELGRRLFFDPRLAGDKSMSCATCHQPEKAWTDGLRRARGLHNRELARNTPSLFNASRNIPHNFFWDGRAVMMEDAILTALHSPVEMNRDLDTLAADLGPIPDYARRFGEVFGPDAITARNVGRALASFVRSEIKVGETPFDRFRGDPSALDASQKRGLVLFVGKARCLFCHAGPFFSDDSHHNNGLKQDDALDDPGRYAIDRNPIYWRAFKTPPLRNVARTAPYMHDGSLATLEDVVEFYNRGGDTEYRDDNIKPLNLTDEEKEDLVSFLDALTGPPSVIAAPNLSTATARGGAGEDVVPQPVHFPYDPPEAWRLDYLPESDPDVAISEVDRTGYPSFAEGEIRPPLKYEVALKYTTADRERMRVALGVAHRYADINAAFADGYRLERNFGLGMGVHMISLDLVMSDEVKAEAPEFLTYSRNRNTGRWQLLQLGYIHRGLDRVKLFDAPEAKGHFHDMNICVRLKDNILRDEPSAGPCAGPGLTRIGPIWMMHFAINIYNENGLFADYFVYANQLSSASLSYSFYGRPVR